MEKVSHLILITDGSANGINVAKTIFEVSESAIEFERAGLIINRLRNESEYQKLNVPEELDCLGWVPEDETIRKNDMDGGSILEINDTPALQSVKKCLSDMEILASSGQTITIHSAVAKTG